MLPEGFGALKVNVPALQIAEITVMVGRFEDATETAPSIAVAAVQGFGQFEHEEFLAYAVLTGEDASVFFQLQPVDLNENEESLRIVQNAVAAFNGEDCRLDCLITPLVEGSKVFSIVDTVIKV